MNTNDDFQIELGESIRRHIEHKKSPREDSSFCTFPYDQPNTDSTPVFIHQNTMQSIENYVTKEKSKEVGGVLLGGFYRTENGAFVEITDFIEATDAQGTDVSLTFTHEAWEQINAEQARRCPDLQVVGWFHSHPALGVFMSKEDEFIHSNFFSEPWHVAIVVDPVYHNWGCFKWTDGKLERAGGLYVFADKKAAKSVRNYVKGLTAEIQTPSRAASANADRRNAASKPNSSGALWAVITLLLILQIATGYFVFKNKPANSERNNPYTMAMELLAASDISGGIQYLREELMADPNNLRAYKEMQQIDGILSNIPNSNNEHFDRINLMLAMADKVAMCKVECEAESVIDTLNKKSENRLELAAENPVKRALIIYEQAQPTRQARLQRAKLICDAVNQKSGKDYKLKNAWYDDAVKWLQEEHLRQIAYGLQSGESKYEQIFNKLDKEEADKVKSIRAGLNKHK